MRGRNDALWMAAATVALTLTIGGLAGAQDVSVRIINGEPTDDYESVGIVGSITWGGFGTGTLIGSRYVLTAAHCGELMEADGTFELDGDIYLVSAVYVHPDYNATSLANDIAVVELDEDVEDVEPSSIYRETPYAGQELILVGYGAGGDGDSGQDGTFGVKMVGTTEIDWVTDTLIVWTFDSPNESDTAYGDSGGPNFVEVDGELFLAGVTSGGTEPDSIYGDEAFSTRVDAFADWIDAIVESDQDEEPDEDEAPVNPFPPGHPPGAHWPGAHQPGAHQPSAHKPGHGQGGHHPGHGSRPPGGHGSHHASPGKGSPGRGERGLTSANTASSGKNSASGKSADLGTKAQGKAAVRSRAGRAGSSTKASASSARTPAGASIRRTERRGTIRRR